MVHALCQAKIHLKASNVSIAAFRPVGAISYETVTTDGLKRDVLFCYDLKLPADFQPTAQVAGASRSPPPALLLLAARQLNDMQSVVFVRTQAHLFRRQRSCYPLLGADLLPVISSGHDTCTTHGAGWGGGRVHAAADRRCR